jgi:hypothetical protein
MNQNNTCKLGRAIAQIIPFQVIKKQEQKGIITTKVLIVMAIVTLVKVAV